MTLDLLAFFARTCGVAVAALLMLMLLRRGSAATQHAVAASALISILALVPMSLVFTRTVPALVTTPVGESFVSRLSIPSTDPPAPAVIEGARDVPVSAPPARPATLNLAPLWGVGSILLVLRLFVGLIRVSRSLRRSSRFDVRPGVLTLADPLGVVPIAVWWGRPMVVLPGNWEGWSAARLDTVMRHEMEHLRRGDCWIQPLSALACAAAWPNPLVWWMASRARARAEQAVDDRVLASGVPAAQYAQDLLDIARQGRHSARGLGHPMATPSGMEGRIRSIMNEQKQRGSITFVAISALGVGFTALAIAASAWSFSPQRVLSTVGRTLSPSVSGSLESLDPLAGTSHGSVASLAIGDQAAMRSPAPPHGESWDVLAAGDAPQISAALAQGSPQQPQRALGAPDVDPSAKYRVEASLYWVGLGAPALPKQFGTWEEPTVPQGDIAIFEKAILAAGGKLQLRASLTRWPAGSFPRPWRSEDDVLPTFDPNAQMDGSVVVRFALSGLEAGKEIIARMRPGERYVVGQHTLDGEHRRIWVFRLVDHARGEEVKPQKLVVREECYSAADLPTGVSAFTRVISARRNWAGYEEGTLNEERLAVFRDQLRELGAKSETAAPVRCLSGQTVSILSHLDDGGEDRTTICMESSRVLRLAVELPKASVAFPLARTRVQTLPRHCYRVTMIQRRTGTWEFFIVSVEPDPA